MLLDANGGFGGAEKCMVEANGDVTLGVDWDVACTKDCVREE